MIKPDPKTSDQKTPNPFMRARTLLNLSQRELAEKLGASFFTVVRLERGELEASDDLVQRLGALKYSKTPSGTESRTSETGINFASSGIRSAHPHHPPLDRPETAMLSEPKGSLLEGVYANSLWGDSDLALSDILLRRQAAAPTRSLPFEEGISAGKNTYTYDAHTYHTKVPPQGIASVISNYLPDGGVVLDPFAGSGMTGVAARYLGHDVVLNELSPAASFISHNFTRTVDTADFKKAVSRVCSNLTALRNQLYSTECRECGDSVELLFTVWSYELDCNYCSETFRLWDHCRKYGNNVREHKLLKKFPCPHCGTEVNKSYLNRRDSVPVFLGYRCCSKRIVEHPLDQSDFLRIKAAKGLLVNYEAHIPRTSLPDGINLSQPKRHGLDRVDKFYTDRNLVACAALWKEIKRIEDPEIAASVGFAFTSLYQRVTRLSEYRFWGGSGNTANFNVPHISNEANVFNTFERKAKGIADHFLTTAQSYKGRVAVRTGSATDLDFLPDNSIDFIFTDPPFGANINYSEMNILWESWLGEFTESDSEAIMSKTQGKALPEYQELMTSSLKESYRVLRPDHWMVLVFMNSSEKVWDSLRNSIHDAGFSIEKVNIFDKQHGTFKQFVNENTTGADLMIHCRKSTSEVLSDKPSHSEIKSVADFIQDEDGHIPVLTFMHVKRKAEIDFRTLYSRYISKAMSEGSSIVDFSMFRSQAMQALGVSA